MEELHVLVNRNEISAFVMACRYSCLEFNFMFECTSFDAKRLWYRVYAPNALKAYQFGRAFERECEFKKKRVNE